ncbi:hypothetical protein WAG19_15970 [Bacillus cereus]|uniref:hypothetical protein n=1 Tax=Bacillus cereus TaxID=1396 RepID=UPI00301312BE
MQKDRALFSIMHTIPGRMDYPIEQYRMTFSDVWSYVNFLEKYGIYRSDNENYILDNVNFRFHPLGRKGQLDEIHLTLKKKESE